MSLSCGKDLSLSCCGKETVVPVVLHQSVRDGRLTRCWPLIVVVLVGKGKRNSRHIFCAHSVESDHIPLFLLAVTPLLPLSCCYHSSIPLIDISFPFLMPCDYLLYFIYDYTASNHSQLLPSNPTESEFSIYLYTLSLTYLSFIVAYYYNRLELQYKLLPSNPTETYYYNTLFQCGHR